MLNGIIKETIMYSIIPVIIIFLFDLVLLITLKKKNNKTNVNYGLLAVIIIFISIILSLITGFIIWSIKFFWIKGQLFNNVTSIMLIVFLVFCLLTIIIWIHLKLLRLIGLDKE